MTLLLLGATRDHHLEGVWRSRGYGMLLEIGNERARVYDYSFAGCLARDKLVPLSELLRAPAVTSDGRQLRTGAADTPTIFVYDRLDRLPAKCVSAPSRGANPLLNFDVFWAYFNEHYAFFAERGVDWRRLRALYRRRVSPETTPAELFTIFEEKLAGLHDRHVSMRGEGRYVNTGLTPWLDQLFASHAELGDKAPDLGLFAKARIRDYLGPAWRRHLDPGSIRDISPNIVVASAAEGRLGYVMLAAESDFSEEKKPGADFAVATAALDSVFGGVRDKQGLILDIRINFGGSDEIALALAGLLTGKDGPGFTKCAHYMATYTPAQPTHIRSRPFAFTGPVIILASTETASAGENFLMMAKDFPNVIVVGEATAGVHSDVLNKSLPNGWQINISNEVFAAPDGSVYETIGVPSHLLVPYYPEKVRATGRDPLLEKAIHLLTGRNFAAAVAAKRSQPLGRPSPCR